MRQTFAIGIAGAAGQGVATSGDIFAKIFSRRGLHLNAYNAIAQRKHEQTGASILAALRFAHHRPAAVIDLTLFSWSGEDHRPRLW